MSNNTQSILEHIYNYGFFPLEQVRSTDPEYAPTLHRMSDELERLSKSLNPDNQERLEKIMNFRSELSIMDSYANFVYGFRHGLLLMHEVLTEWDHFNIS